MTSTGSHHREHAGPAGVRPGSQAAAPRPWAQAWAWALYGPDGFYRRPEGPAGHFRTACHAAPGVVAAVVADLAARSGCTAVLDVGAGRGELAGALAAAAPGLRVHAADVVDRPASLPAAVGWSRTGWTPGPAPGGHLDLAAVAPQAWRGALVTCFELLDVVPATVVEVDDGGVPRVVAVRPDGREELAGPVDPQDAGWLERWWPGLAAAGPGARAEVGRSRDEAWSTLVRAAAAGGAQALLAVDYGHDRAGRPDEGSLSGFRAGRAVPPRPDRSTDVTAHVALDAVAAAGEAAGAARTASATQAAVLTAWAGRSAGPHDPDALRELADPGALGGFTWLLQTLPALPALPRDLAFDLRAAQGGNRRHEHEKEGRGER